MGGQGGPAFKFPSLADTSCNVFTFVTRGTSLPNPVYPSELHPGVQEQTHRGHRTLYSVRLEVNATARLCKTTAQLLYLLLRVVCLQPTEEIILFIHRTIALVAP